MRAAVIWIWTGLLAHLSYEIGASLLRSGSVNGAGYITFDYSKHGQDWGIGVCASQSKQSPIDFPATALSTPASGQIYFMYKKVTGPLELLNNGHSYSLDLAGLGYGGITHENAWYNLLYINVHAKSEHTVGGQHKPVELHMVHKKFDSDSLIIIAIPLDCVGLVPGNCAATFASPNSHSTQQSQYTIPAATDPYFNSAFQSFLSAPLPSVKSKLVVPPDLGAPMDLNSFVQGGTYFEYAGSTTAPPCAEIVTWLVRREPLLASYAQVKALHDGIYALNGAQGNFRDVQPLNDRPISIRVAVGENPPLNAESIRALPPSLSVHPDKGFTAMRWAKDALRVSGSASDYIQDLDRRVRNAAQAHSNALSPQYATTLTMTTTSPLNMLSATPNVDAETEVKSMTATIAAATKYAIASAVQQISLEARASAIEAAKEAAATVMSSLSNSNQTEVYPRIEVRPS